MSVEPVIAFDPISRILSLLVAMSSERIFSISWLFLPKQILLVPGSGSMDSELAACMSSEEPPVLAESQFYYVVVLCNKSENPASENYYIIITFNMANFAL